MPTTGSEQLVNLGLEDTAGCKGRLTFRRTAPGDEPLLMSTMTPIEFLILDEHTAA
ncbi:MAG: hypothetical protein ACLTLQ_08325 [[Clostridium] scindens]